jgi:hypothetical protein
MFAFATVAPTWHPAPLQRFPAEPGYKALSLTLEHTARRMFGGHLHHMPQNVEFTQSMHCSSYYFILWWV